MFTAQLAGTDNQPADVDQQLSLAAPGGLSGDNECGKSDTGSNGLNAVVEQQPPQAMQPPQKITRINKRSTNPKQATDAQVMTETLISSGLIAGVNCEDNPAKKRENSHLFLSVAQLLKLLKVLLADSDQTDSYLKGKFRKITNFKHQPSQVSRKRMFYRLDPAGAWCVVVFPFILALKTTPSQILV